jgi:predicted MFS family arabinose efflux permease
MTVMSVIGAYTAQAVVTRIGSRGIGAVGMTLIAVACLLLTRVSFPGSYIDDIFLGLLIFGAGLGAAFVASQIAALGGAADEESGLAAGLVDSSFNIGGALGIAILSTVAVASTDESLTRTADDAQLRAITDGYQSAFAVAVGVALVGLCVALLLLGRTSPATESPATIEPETD